MKDFLNNELAVGDEVVFCRPDYRSLCKGKITSFTNKKVHVAYIFHYDNNPRDYLALPKQLIKILKP